MGTRAHLALASALAVAGAALAPRAASAQEPVPPPKPVVRIAVVETVDGNPSDFDLAAFFLAKKFKDAGFEVIAPPRAGATAEKTRDATGVAPPADATPPARYDILVRATVEAKLKNRSEFYGRTLAYVYHAHAKVEVFDPSGKALANVEEDDEWGKQERKDAKAENLKRVTFWMIASLFKQDAVHGLIPKASQAAVDEWVQRTEAQRRKKPKEE